MVSVSAERHLLALQRFDADAREEFFTLAASSDYASQQQAVGMIRDVLAR